jgi:two-component system cell cycle response regulator
MHAVVVDPSRVVLKLISKLIADRGGTTAEFLDSDAALRHVKDNPAVDTLITSLEVQPLTGLELCWEARMGMPPQRPLYIMVMSSLSDESKLAEALDCGGDDMIAKPLNPLEFHARMRMAGRLKQAQLHLVYLAETDPLTSLLNRRAFFEKLDDRLLRPDLAATTSALLIDIDNFKGVNDAHGHSVGDQVIRAFAGEVLKVSDLAGRIGGEEFAAAITGLPDNRLMKLAENLRRACAETTFTADGKTFSATCSIGVSRWVPGDSSDDLLKRADVGLYQAKADGRNRVRSVTEKQAVAAEAVGAVRKERRLR